MGYPPKRDISKEDMALNRENKKKKYEKVYYKHHPCNEIFTCKLCGRQVIPDGAGSNHRNHCPNCLTFEKVVVSYTEKKDAVQAETICFCLYCFFI